MRVKTPSHLFSNSNWFFFHHASTTSKWIFPREHSFRKIQQAMNKKPNNTTSKARVPLLVSFHQNFHPLRYKTYDNHCILHFSILHSSNRLQDAVPETPVLTHMCPCNVRDLIVRTAPKSSLLTDEIFRFRCEANLCMVYKDHLKKWDTAPVTSTTLANIWVATSRVRHLMRYFIFCRESVFPFLESPGPPLRVSYVAHLQSTFSGVTRQFGFMDKGLSWIHPHLYS